MKSLEEVLAYRNDYVVQTFRQHFPKYNLTDEQAKTLFDDLKRYLWLTAVTDAKKAANPEEKFPDISISESMIIIDEIWHEFILVTEHYYNFCQEYFGKYIHHPPPMPRWEENIQSKSEYDCYEIFVNELLNEVYDYLGEEVTFRWFDTYRSFLPDNHTEEISHHYAK